MLNYQRVLQLIHEYKNLQHADVALLLVTSVIFRGRFIAK
jgi:hypothetical protein